MVINHSTVRAPNDIVASADWNANHSGTLNHGTELTNVTSDQHHAQLHNAASHSDIASTGAQIDGAVGASHTRSHTLISTSDHTSAATPGQILKADANGLPIDATNTDAQVSGAVTASHAAITLHASATTGGLSLAAQEISNRAATNAQTGYATAAHITAIEANTLKETNVTTNLSAGTRTATTIDVNSSDGTNATLVEADTTNAGILGSDKWDEIVANTAAKHTQNTDTALGSGCEAADHGTAATDQVVNVCYGTGAPPTANTTTEGALFVQYTA